MKAPTWHAEATCAASVPDPKIEHRRDAILEVLAQRDFLYNLVAISNISSGA
jgi:hypothetical protein